MCDRAPVGVAQNSGDRVGKEHERHRDKDFLDPAKTASNHEIPDHDRAKWHGDIFADTKELSRGADSDEFGDRDAAIRDQHDGYGEERPADAKAFADQVEQAAPGRRTQSRAHLLHHGERER